MKKLISLILVAVLALAGFASADDVTGTWYLTAMTQGEMTVDPAMIGMEITMTLNPDGTADMNALGEVTSGSWTVEGANVTITVDGTPQTFVYDGTALVADLGDMGMKFERTAGETYVRPAEVYATDISQFDGEWTAYKAGVMGMYMDVALLASFVPETESIDMTMKIANGAVSSDGSEASQFELVDGLLFLEGPGLNGESSSMRIQLLEDGTIELDTNMGFTIIFARAEAAQQAA